MATIELHEAKIDFSKLVDRGGKGVEIVIARSGKAEAKLTRVVEKPKRRDPGRDEGKIRIAEDFNQWTEDLHKDLFTWIQRPYAHPMLPIERVPRSLDPPFVTRHASRRVSTRQARVPAPRLAREFHVDESCARALRGTA